MGLHQAVYVIGMSVETWLGGILADSLGIQPMFGWTTVGDLGLSLVAARILHAKNFDSVRFPTANSVKSNFYDQVCLVDTNY
jgi:predicted MFS family arabinose efflux permease